MRSKSCSRINAPLLLAALALALVAPPAQAQRRANADAIRQVQALAQGAAAAPTGIHRTPDAPLPLPARDRWLGFDKVQHFTFSFLFTVGGQYVLVNKADVSEGAALPFAAGAGAGIGLAKELYDERRPGGSGFSPKDLFWDALGIATASLLIAL